MEHSYSNYQFLDKKRFVFLGDSIAKHGHFIYDMRNFFHVNRTNCSIFNRGIGGNRAEMAEFLLKEEVVSLKPDYCFICYGVNDLGIWLYDSFKETDDKILQARKDRNEKYFSAITRVVQILKENNIMPILMSPYPVDEDLEEKPDIPTLGDNEEKEDFIGPWFYKKETFRNINDAFSKYAEQLEILARQENVMFYDNFNNLKQKVKAHKGAFREDGIHFSEFGHSLIAQGLLEFMGFENATFNFASDQDNDEIFKLEQQERSTAFIRFNLYNAIHGRNVTSKQIFNEIKARLENSNLEEWLKITYTDYINNFGKLNELKDKIIQLTENYCFNI